MVRSLLLVAVLALSVRAEQTAYANSSMDLPAGARLPGMGNVSLGMPGDASFLLANPAALAELTRPEGFFHHANLYQDIDVGQDEIFGALPLGNGVVAGFGGQRVSVGSILKVGESETPDFSNPKTFDAADWTLAGGISRSFYDGTLLTGALARLSWRDLDQYGIGAQLDASAVWKPVDGLRVGARLERAIATATVWESGRREWSPMDLSLGLGYEGDVAYLYGRGSVGIETPGLFQNQASNTFTTEPSRFWEDPGLFLRTCRVGAEFRFNWGGVIRAGAEIQALTRWRDFFEGKDEQGLYGESKGQAGFGVGYVWNQRLRLDYALQSTPDLGVSHRISAAWMFGTPPPPKKRGDDEPIPPEEFGREPADDEDSDTATPVETLDSRRPTVPVPAPAKDAASAPADASQEPPETMPTPPSAPVPSVSETKASPAVAPSAPVPPASSAAPEVAPSAPSASLPAAAAPVTAEPRTPSAVVPSAPAPSASDDDAPPERVAP
jgi:hypothetical protein